MHIYKRAGKRIGEYKSYDTCRFCLSKKMKPFVEFGNVPLAGGFLQAGSTEEDFAQERFYPLNILFCTECGLVQVREVVESNVLFEEYFYRSSAIGTLVDHFSNYASELSEMFDKKTKQVSVLEIGSNDGVFLKPLLREGFRTLGIDPAKNIVEPLIQEGLPIKCDYFGERSASAILESWGQADVIVGSNSLAHIDDMHDVLRGIDLLLKPDGFLALETHYLGKLLEEYQYDMMYHEHQSYYSLFSLERFFAMYDMEIFDAKHIPIHAGSMRYYVQRRGGPRKKTARLKKLLQWEEEKGLGEFSTFRAFSKDIAHEKQQLMKLVKKLTSQGKTLMGYGASGRATIMMTYCGLTNEHLTAVIDDAPAKQGAYTPGNHLEIVSSSLLNDPKKRPDYCVLFAWSFEKEIMAKNAAYLESGGQFIVPLPNVHIVGKQE
jgi:methylation protein EvaC